MNGLGVFHGIKMYQVNEKDIIAASQYCKIGMHMLGCSKAQKANEKDGYKSVQHPQLVMSSDNIDAAQL